MTWPTFSPDELVELCRDVDVVFHLAAEKHNSAKATPERIIDVNISATRRLFDAAGRAGCSKVVFASSLYAYGSMGPLPMHESDTPAPVTIYGMSKLAGEHMLRVAAREHPLGADGRAPVLHLRPPAVRRRRLQVGDRLQLRAAPTR